MQARLFDQRKPVVAPHRGRGLAAMVQVEPAGQRSFPGDLDQFRQLEKRLSGPSGDDPHDDRVGRVAR